jgi:hypothetical protein
MPSSSIASNHDEVEMETVNMEMPLANTKKAMVSKGVIGVLAVVSGLSLIGSLLIINLLKKTQAKYGPRKQSKNKPNRNQPSK